MESPRDAAFLVAVVALLLLVSTAVPTDAEETASDRVKQACRKYKEDEAGQAPCLHVLLNEPKINKTKDMRALANLALEMAKANATKCVKAVHKLREQKGLPEALLPVLDFCAKNFEASASQFKRAKLTSSTDAQSTSYDVMRACDGPRDCESRMGEKNVTDAEVVGLANNISFFAEIADAVITLVH